MLETLVEWVTNAIANGLDALVVGFMQALNFSISSIAEAFPILVTAYAVFQSVALALIVIIAGYHIWKYTTGQLSEATETPGSILFRAFAAGVLVFMGGYIVQWVVDIAKLPYDAILALDAATGIWQTEGIIESNLNVTELVLNC